MLKKRVAYTYFKSACYILITWAMAHLILHFAFSKPMNPTEAKLFSFMTSYEKPFVGGKMTAMDIQNGLNICYALFLFFTGFFNLWLFKKLLHTQLIYNIAIISSIPFIAGTVISIFYFFWVPVVMFFIVAFCFTVTWWKLR
jgi:hypothetical protein